MTDFKFAEQIIEILQFIFEKLGIAFDWTVDNVAPYIQKALEKFTSWKTSEYIFWICFGQVLLIIGILLIILDSRMWDTGLVVIGMLMAFIGLIVAAVFSYYLIRVINFPELQFYKWVMNNVQAK